MNIWGSFEMSCASKDLSYDDYVMYLNKHRFGHKPLSKESYALVSMILNTEMEKDMQQKPLTLLSTGGTALC